jgi:hypothetical protein
MPLIKAPIPLSGLMGHQFYPMCTNLNITGDGSSPLPKAQGIKLPGGYRADDPFLKVNLFDGSLEKQNYVAPGPKVFTAVPSHTPRDAFACNFARSNRRHLSHCLLLAHRMMLYER